jgi:hypothetical protein
VAQTSIIARCGRGDYFQSAQALRAELDRSYVPGYIRAPIIAMMMALVMMLQPSSQSMGRKLLYLRKNSRDLEFNTVVFIVV